MKKIYVLYNNLLQTKLIKAFENNPFKNNKKSQAISNTISNTTVFLLHFCRISRFTLSGMVLIVNIPKLKAQQSVLTVELSN